MFYYCAFAKGYVNITIYYIIQGVLENLNLNITNLKVTSKLILNLKIYSSNDSQQFMKFYRCFIDALRMLCISYVCTIIVNMLNIGID